MPTDRELIAFKIGARARKLANEDCLVEGYELLYTAIAEAQQQGDAEMERLLQRELEKYEKRFLETTRQGTMEEKPEGCGTRLKDVV